MMQWCLDRFHWTIGYLGLSWWNLLKKKKNKKCFTLLYFTLNQGMVMVGVECLSLKCPYTFNTLMYREVPSLIVFDSYALACVSRWMCECVGGCVCALLPFVLYTNNASNHCWSTSGAVWVLDASAWHSGGVMDYLLRHDAIRAQGRHSLQNG